MQRRVEGVADPQPRGLAARAASRGDQRRHRVLVAGQHHGLGAVDRGDGDRPSRTSASGPAPRPRCACTATIAPPRGQRLHQPARARRPAVPRRPARARRRRARRPARRSSGRPGSRAAPRSDSSSAEQRDLDGEQRGLGVVGAVAARPLSARRRTSPRAAGRSRQRGRSASHTSSNASANTGKAAAQLAAHAGPLGALAGEQERHLAGAARGARAQRRCVGAVGERARVRRAAPSRSAAGDRGAVVAARPGWWPASTPTSAGRVAGRVGEVRAQPRGLGRAAASSLRAGQQPGGAAGARAAGRRRRPRVRPRRSAASSRMTCALVPLMPNEETPARRGRSRRRPGPGLGQQLDRARRTSRRAATAASTCRVRGSTPCRIASDHLDDAGDAGRGLGVPDVRLHRAEPAAGRPAAGPGRRWRAAPAPRSGRRAWCRCRAPRRRRRRPAASPASASAWPDHPLLGRAVRRGQAVGRAVLVDRGAAHARPAPGGRCGGRRTAAPAAAGRRPRPSRCRRRRRRTTCSGRPGARPRCRLNSTNAPGVAITVTPPASASVALAARAAPAPARCRATSDDEQAVSTVTAGPSQAERVGDPAGGDAARACR